MIAPSSPALRFVRALFTLWVAFVLTQPVAVHACAMRNGTLMTPPEMGHAHLDAAAPESGDVMRIVMHHDASSPAGQTNNGCHCFGECAATASVALLSSRVTIPAPPHVLAARIAIADVEQSFEQPTYLHPPATAPPIA